jgi:hypothetical protein
MKLRGCKSPNNAMTIQWRAFVSTLLLLYVAVYLYPPGSFPHVHQNEELHHGDSCRKDACHIAIYHPGSEGACHHKSHLTRSPETCPWCKIISTRQFHPPVLLQEIVCSWDYYLTSDPAVAGTVSITILHADRGPPLSLV